MIRHLNAPRKRAKNAKRKRAQPRYKSGPKKGQFRPTKRRATSAKRSPAKRRRPLTTKGKQRAAARRVGKARKRLRRTGYRVSSGPAMSAGPGSYTRVKGIKKKRAKVGGISSRTKTYRVANRRRRRNASPVLTATVKRRSPNRRRAYARRRNQGFAGLGKQIMSAFTDFGAIRAQVGGAMVRGLGGGVANNVSGWVNRLVAQYAPGMLGNPLYQIAQPVLVTTLVGAAAHTGIARTIAKAIEGPNAAGAGRSNLELGAADLLRDQLLLTIYDLAGRPEAVGTVLGFFSPAVAIATQMVAAAPPPEETAGSLVDSSSPGVTAGVIETNGVISMRGGGADQMAMAGLTAYGGEYYNMG